MAVETFDIFARTVAPEDVEFEPPEGYAFRWGTPEDVEACEEHHTGLDERERADGVRRLSLGHRVVVCVPEGGDGAPIVFTMWENPRNVNVPGLVKLPLAAHQSFIYKAYTSPDHRGRKLYQAGMRFVLAELAREGKTELVGYAHVNKDVSRGGLARLAFEPVGRLWSVAMPGGRRTLRSRRTARRFAIGGGDR